MPDRRMIGVYGGTFDPIHYGHLRTALEVSESLGLDEMRWVPCGQPPHRRQPQASASDRLHMLELAFGEAPAGFVIDRRELEREGPSYMVDTLTSMRSQWPDVSLCLVLGQDAFLGLNTWHRWRDLLRLAHVVVMRRPGALPMVPDGELASLVSEQGRDEVAALRCETAGCVHFVEVTQLSISATRIRELLYAGRRPDYLLPAAVVTYVRERGLYRQPGTAP
ncbi:MAG: putative nicotinate-nucleotide adenylyltransferase [Proteobacteria bacterium]|nr:putative nicotinate-nucleotide adenylyltransferase [Pseudomonadota bacterium]